MERKPVRKSKISFKSQKGDAIILLSVLVTGILMLVSAMAVDNLRRSASLQNIQKSSINELYKAEEGIEFSLFANKEKIFSYPLTSTRSFDISHWENNTESLEENLISGLSHSAQNRQIIVSSKSRPSTLVNPGDSALRRTVFANLPSRYYDQLNLWDFANWCTAAGCELSDSSSNMVAGRTYQVAVNLSDFQKTGWTVDSTQYRAVFRCGPEGCGISNLQIGLECDFSQCPISCPTLMNMNMWNLNISMAGPVVTSEWFKFLNPEGTILDLRNQKILVSFRLDSGTVGEITNMPIGTDLRMCKEGDGGTWEAPIYDRIGGLANIELKLKNENIQYTCVEWEQIPVVVCDGYEDVCLQWDHYCVRSEQSCCGGYANICSGYPQLNYDCVNRNPGDSCGCIYDPCTGAGGCTSTCVQECQQWCDVCVEWGDRCLQWDYNRCINPHTVYQNGKCIRYSRN